MEKIANKAGVHKRVAQVWFQNARARQKKEKGKKKGTKFSKLDNHWHMVLEEICFANHD